jgi:leader peptidase (prepilin peptidase) / N-methyltransferase
VGRGRSGASSEGRLTNVDVYSVILALIVGGVAGSVINVVATRLPAEGDPPVIGSPLRPRTQQADTFGLLPWVGAWQRSAGGIDLPKLGTDFGATLISAIAFMRYDDWFVSLRAAVFALILLLILRIDWQHHLIFTITIAPAILVALLLQALDSMQSLMWAVGASLGAATVFALLFMLALVMYRRRALGFGDVLLAALIGAMTGALAHVAIMLGVFLAAIGGLFLIAIRLRGRTDYIPYGAYLCLGAIIVIL